VLTNPYQVGARVADGELVFGGNIGAPGAVRDLPQDMLAMEARKGAPQPGDLREFHSLAATYAAVRAAEPCMLAMPIG
jgi:hypothetical protein